MSRRFALGLDFGTNSVRALTADTATGEEISTDIRPYRRGEEGIVLRDGDPDLARQHPQDYMECLQDAVHGALRGAEGIEGFSIDRMVGSRR